MSNDAQKEIDRLREGFDVFWLLKLKGCILLVYFVSIQLGT